MKNLIYREFQAVQFSNQFTTYQANEATRRCETLGECSGLLPRLIADAYLMGGEL